MGGLTVLQLLAMNTTSRRLVVLVAVCGFLFLLSACGKQSETSQFPASSSTPDYSAGRRAYDAGDYATAYKIWSTLASQGDTGSQFFLGYLYEMGLGVQRDYGEAIKWYTLSADQNMGDAQARLSRLLMAGLGGPPDYVQAYKWAAISSELGNADAKKTLSELQALMKPAEITEGTRVVQEWKTKRSKLAPKQ